MHLRNLRVYRTRFRQTGRVLLGTLGGVCRLVLQNPDPISDQKMSFSTLVFSGNLSPYPFQTWPLGRNYVMIT